MQGPRLLFPDSFHINYAICEPRTAVERLQDSYSAVWFLYLALARAASHSEVGPCCCDFLVDCETERDVRLGLAKFLNLLSRAGLLPMRENTDIFEPTAGRIAGIVRDSRDANKDLESPAGGLTSFKFSGDDYGDVFNPQMQSPGEGCIHHS